jgi:hypothetical protein
VKRTPVIAHQGNDSNLNEGGSNIWIGSHLRHLEQSRCCLAGMVAILWHRLGSPDYASTAGVPRLESCHLSRYRLPIPSRLGLTRVPNRWVSYVLRIREWSGQAFLWALLAVGISTGLRIILAEFGATLYFATFFPTILLVAVFAGTPAAILSSALTALIVWWAFIPPQYEFAPLRITDVANFATFLLSVRSIIVLAHVFRTTLSSLLKSEQSRELLIAELNHRSGNMLAIMQAIISGTVGSPTDRQKIIDRDTCAGSRQRTRLQSIGWLFDPFNYYYERSGALCTSGSITT